MATSTGSAPNQPHPVSQLVSSASVQFSWPHKVAARNVALNRNKGRPASYCQLQVANYLLPFNPLLLLYRCLPHQAHFAPVFIP